MKPERIVSTKNIFEFPICNFCKFNEKNGKCKAFPNGIPEEILTNEFDHHQAYKNDHGIQFEKI